MGSRVTSPSPVTSARPRAVAHGLALVYQSARDPVHFVRRRGVRRAVRRRIRAKRVDVRVGRVLLVLEPALPFPELAGGGREAPPLLRAKHPDVAREEIGRFRLVRAAALATRLGRRLYVRGAPSHGVAVVIRRLARVATLAQLRLRGIRRSTAGTPGLLEQPPLLGLAAVILAHRAQRSLRARAREPGLDQSLHERLVRRGCRV
mmetsp:Transcript_9043/g.38308  ORF Transcript_9043/g.38308 Transcript_9043/m.38308 type:complete len:205 (-) Transcript_9043:164-778(-)